MSIHQTPSCHMVDDRTEKCSLNLFLMLRVRSACYCHQGVYSRRIQNFPRGVPALNFFYQISFSNFQLLTYILIYEFDGGKLGSTPNQLAKCLPLIFCHSESKSACYCHHDLFEGLQKIIEGSQCMLNCMYVHLQKMEPTENVIIIIIIIIKGHL